MMDDQQKSDLEKIQAQEAKGNIVFAGIDIMCAPLDEFIKQPTEGILYDLNRDKVTTISLADTNDNMRLRWINDYAVAVVIEKLKQELDRLQSAALWVPVSEPPKENCKVYLWARAKADEGCDCFPFTTVIGYYIDGRFTTDFFVTKEFYRTHWKPFIDEPPQG